MRNAINNLNSIMEMEHVIRVHEDGSVSDAPGEYAPEICVQLNADGQTTNAAETDMIAMVEGGWDLMTGYSGQYRYHGPIMSPAEFVGGGLADDILGMPGLYVAVEVSALRENESDEYSDDAIGWVVARKLSGARRLAARRAETESSCPDIVNIQRAKKRNRQDGRN